VIVTRRGNVRRAKLFYLRDRVGKKTRVKELVGDKVRRDRDTEKARRAAVAAAESAQEAASSDDSAEEAVNA
jgi:large subunit ribosomal protein L19